MKKQLVIVRSTLGTINETVNDAEYNENKMKEGLTQLQARVASFESRLENTTYLLSLKIAIESHIAQALDASHVVLRALDILVDNIAEAQKGSLPPRVISPALLMGALRRIGPSLPTDTTFPFPLSKDYLPGMYQLSDVCVYTYQQRLGYVISVPLVHKETFRILRMIPIPVPVESEHFLYIDVRYSVIGIDQAKQYYFTLTDDQLSSCKIVGQGHYVCTHQRTLLSTIATESCAVALLHKPVTFPSECETRVVRLSNTVWTQLNNN
jgi:hypothetical protein